MHIYAIMKTMYLPGYHHNDFVATHVLGHIMYPTVQHELPQNHCGDNPEVASIFRKFLLNLTAHMGK